MLIQEVKLTRNVGAKRFTGAGYRVELCARILRRMFAIPCNTAVIWVSLHDRPSQNRYRIQRADSLDPFPGFQVEGTREYILSGTRKFLGFVMGDLRTVYVEVDYEVQP